MNDGDLIGCSFETDQRLLLIPPGDGEPQTLTEYNDEITGFTPGLVDAFPDGVVRYGGNAYYVRLELARRGWREQGRP